MKIGLVRHFKVKKAFPKKFLVSNTEVLQWFDEYELAGLEYEHVDLCGVEWTKCYSSPLLRAVHTANIIYKGEITETNQLRELEILPFMDKKIRLPFLIWGMFIRIKSSSSNDTVNTFRARLRTFVDELLYENDKDVLIVSHGFVMLFLQKELLKRGFSGTNFRTPANGKVYVFEKTQSSP